MRHRSTNHRHAPTFEKIKQYVNTATKVAGLVQGAVGALRYIASLMLRVAAAAAIPWYKKMKFTLQRFASAARHHGVRAYNTARHLARTLDSVITTRTRINGSAIPAVLQVQKYKARDQKHARAGQNSALPHFRQSLCTPMTNKTEGEKKASYGIRPHDLPFTERVLCQLS